MLPFLKHSQDASASAPVQSIKRSSDSEEEYDSLDSASDDLISAVHAKDTKAVSAALRAAFELVDSQPHAEGEHTNGE